MPMLTFDQVIIAEASPMKTAFASMRLGWTAYVVPFLFIASPNLLMQGDPANVALAVLAAVCGVALISIGATGHFLRPIRAWHRALFAICGSLALVPKEISPWGLWGVLSGVVIGLALIGCEFFFRPAIDEVSKPRTPQQPLAGRRSAEPPQRRRSQQIRYFKPD